MNTSNISVRAIITTALLFLSGSSSADVSGMLTMCGACHGQDGRGMQANVPIIAGVPAIIQEDALYAYADGDRNCGAVPMMCNVVSGLTEDQVIELAAHFAAMPFAPASEEFDTELAAAGESLHKKDCAICHGADDPGEAEAGILHGQRRDYLRFALQQYAAGERTQLPAMEKVTNALSADDIEALINYYASYRE